MLAIRLDPIWGSEESRVFTIIRTYLITCFQNTINKLVFCKKTHTVKSQDHNWRRVRFSVTTSTIRGVRLYYEIRRNIRIKRGHDYLSFKRQTTFLHTNSRDQCHRYVFFLTHWEEPLTNGSEWTGQPPSRPWVWVWRRKGLVTRKGFRETSTETDTTPERVSYMEEDLR